mmetsp:Transcript_23076/g.36866  ORF Transcript_23076/g.36866 Transcript_23076/m.36866 type:complete len:232 (-) Transcript_23076:67-762(-)
MKAFAFGVAYIAWVVCGHRVERATRYSKRSKPLQLLQSLLVSTKAGSSPLLVRSSRSLSANPAEARREALLRVRGGADESEAVDLLSSEAELSGALEMAGDKLVVVDFYADWCKPCQQLAPHFAKLARTTDPNKVVFYKVNADSAQDALKARGVSMLPTLLLYRKGVLVNTIVGGDLGALSQEIKKATSNALVRTLLSAQKHALTATTLGYMLMPWHLIRPGWSSIYKAVA